jgi:hypothetical protein
VQALAGAPILSFVRIMSPARRVAPPWGRIPPKTCRGLTAPAFFDVGEMSKHEEPESIFDFDAIAERNIDEAKLRATAFDLALRCAQWYGGGQRPANEIAVLANKIYVWFHTGKYPDR